MIFDVVLANRPTGVLSSLLSYLGSAGMIQERLTSEATVRAQYRLIGPFAKLTKGQYGVWRLSVLALGGEGAQVPFSVSWLPFTFNCQKWAVEAASAAFVIQALPLP
jgi:hypothetical protein